MPRARASATTAWASGCSLALCRLAAAASSAASSWPAAATKATSRGRPTVSVPVLSNATVSTRWASSSAWASLIRMPCFAATPVPAMMAAGVASPSAQGQAITSTATAWISAVSSPAPAHHQPASVSSASSTTTGTNTADTRSTSRWIGAFAACASSTSRMICASTVCVPTAATCITTRPSPFTLPPGERLARAARHRQRLAGEHGLVDLGLAFQHAAIGRNAFAGPHCHAVAGQQLGQRHVDLAAGALQHVRHLGPQRVQCADRGHGLALGARFQPLAQQHQRHDHRRSLEVQHRMRPRRGLQPEPDRQAPARAGAQRHQQIHVAGTGLQRMPAGAVEARAQHELHGRGQHELQPGRQHPVRAPQAAEHRQQQRRRQQQAQARGRETAPARCGLGGFRRAGPRLVARIAHRSRQPAGIELRRRLVGDACGLGGQVDRGLLHAGHLFQRAFHPADAGGTGHAANTEIEMGQRGSGSGNGRGRGRRIHGTQLEPCHHGKRKRRPQQPCSAHGLVPPRLGPYHGGRVQAAATFNDPGERA